MLEAVERRDLPFDPAPERQAHQYPGELVVGRCIDDKGGRPGPSRSPSSPHCSLRLQLGEAFKGGNHLSFDELSKLLSRKRHPRLDDFSLYQVEHLPSSLLLCDRAVL